MRTAKRIAAKSSGAEAHLATVALHLNEGWEDQAGRVGRPSTARSEAMDWYEQGEERHLFLRSAGHSDRLDQMNQ